MTTKLLYKELLPITSNRNQFVEVIYNNFLSLSVDTALKHTKEEIDRLLSSRNMYGFIVYNDNVLIGYLIGERMDLNDGRHVYYITYLYVASKYRNKGVGEQLVRLAVNKTHDIGVNFVLLKCDANNTSICKFYQTRGFVPDPILKDSGKYLVLSYFL